MSKKITRLELFYGILYFSAVVAVLLCFFPKTANADAIVSQYNTAGGSASNSVKSFVQKIGTGYSGSVDSLSVYVGVVSGTDSGSTITLAAYSDSSYSSASFADWCSGIHAPKSVGFTGWVTDAVTSCTLNPALYYAVIVGTSASTGAVLNIYGGGGTFPQVQDCSSLTNLSSGCTTFASYLNMAFAISVGGFTPPATDFTTHFIFVLPYNGTTTSTTTIVGADLNANAADFPSPGRLHVHFYQDSAFACQQSGAVYDAIFRCTGPNAPQDPFDIDFTGTLEQLVAGTYSLSTTTTFTGGGVWIGSYEIQQVSSPWYFFGLKHTYNTIVSTTTRITIGTTSPMDQARGEVRAAMAEIASTSAHGIAAILASTTASWKGSCNFISTSFDLGDCLTLTIWPGSAAISDDISIIKQTPPWGYVFRMIDILNATTTDEAMPTISYSFASSSPMSAVGNIHFDPFTEIANAGTLINEMKSDRDESQTVWTIMMPIVKIFMYLVLGFMIIHDLTGIHSEQVQKKSRDNNLNK